MTISNDVINAGRERIAAAVAMLPQGSNGTGKDLAAALRGIIAIEAANSAADDLYRKHAVEVHPSRLTPEGKEQIGREVFGALIAKSDALVLEQVEAALARVEVAAQQLEADAEPKGAAEPPPSNPAAALAVVLQRGQHIDDLVARFQLATPTQRNKQIEGALDAAIEAGDAAKADAILSAARKALAPFAGPGVRLFLSQLESKLNDSLRPPNWQELESQAAAIRAASVEVRRALGKATLKADSMARNLGATGAAHVRKRAREGLRELGKASNFYREIDSTVRDALLALEGRQW